MMMISGNSWPRRKSLRTHSAPNYLCRGGAHARNHCWLHVVVTLPASARTSGAEACLLVRCWTLQFPYPVPPVALTENREEPV